MSDAEKARIRRRISDAMMHFDKLQAARKHSEIQHGWESFLFPWKSALGLMDSYTKQNGFADLKTEMYEKRMACRIIDYAWNARNQEEHDSIGGTDAEDGSVSVTVDGQTVKSSRPYLLGEDVAKILSANGRILLNDGEFRLRAVPGKKGTFVGPPPNMSAAQIAQNAMHFAHEYAQKLNVLG